MKDSLPKISKAQTRTWRRLLGLFAASLCVAALAACGDSGGGDYAARLRGHSGQPAQPEPTPTPRPTIQPGPTSPADVAGGIPKIPGPNEACVYETSPVPREGWREHRPTDGGPTVWVEPVCEWVTYAPISSEDD